ncbi:LamG domain-containing protein, partial [bacterium]|nr:LamG domain-containing protein [bacterium]
WAKVETLGDDGWMKLKGQDTSDNWWGVYLNNYDQGGKFYTLDGYSWQTEQSSQPPKTGLGWLKSGYSSSDSAAPLAPLAFDNFSVLNYGCTDNSPNLYLKWTPSTWAERYNYYRCQADSSDDCSTCTYSEYPVSHTACAAAECSQADSGTEQDTGYCYKVVAENETGTTEVTGSPYFKKTGLCAPSEGPAADGTVCGKIKLVWQKGSYADIDGYNVYRSLTPDGCDTTITTPGIAYGAPYVYDSTTCELIAHAGEAVDAAVDSSGNQHLIAHWKMNGDWTDSSGNGNDGTAHGNATFIDGKFKEAGTFDGDGDYVLVPSNENLRLTNNFTVEAWIKVNDVNDYHTIVMHDENGGGNDAYGLRVDPGGNITFFALNANKWDAQHLTSAETIEPGRWYHVAGIYDKDYNLRVYINGKEASNSPKAASGDVVYEVTTNLNIGRRCNGSLFFNGLIDNVAIYDYARSPQEILRDAEAFPLDETPTETNNTCNITSDITISSATNYTLTCDATTPCCRVFDNRIIPNIPYYYRITVTNPQGESPATEIPSAQLDGCVDASDPTNFRHSCDKSICYPAPSVYEEK